MLSRIAHSPEGKEIVEKPLDIKQGNWNISEYALEFRTLVASCGWNKPALKAVYQQELCPDILIELYCHDKQAIVYLLINLSICLSQILKQETDHLLKKSPLLTQAPQSPCRLVELSLVPLDTNGAKVEDFALKATAPKHLVSHCPEYPSPQTMQPPQE